MNKYNSNTGNHKGLPQRKSIRLKGYDYSQAGLYFITICCQDMLCRFGHIADEQMILNEFGTVAYNEWAKLPERFPNFELDVFQIMPNHMHGIILLHDVGAGLAPAPNNTTTTVGAGFTPALNDNSHLKNDNSYFGNDNSYFGNDNSYFGNDNSYLGNDNSHLKNENSYLGNDNSHLGNDNSHLEKGQPQGLPLQMNVGVDNGAGVNLARTPTRTNATIGDIVGAYKSLVSNECIDICNEQNIRLGKLWQRNYHEHIIRDEKSYHTISEYIINNPANWNADKFYK